MEDGVEICNMNGLDKSDCLRDSTEILAGAGNEGSMQDEESEQAGSSSASNGSGDNFSRQYPCAPAPAMEIKLFVGRIPRTMSDNDVLPLFSKFGEVIEVAIIRDRNTSVHKGSAFVRMACIAEADAAIRELNGQKVLDTSLGPILVKYATGEAEKLGITSAAGEAGLDQAKLFVGSLPKSITDEKVKQLFEAFGTVDEIYVMRDASGAGKGCAFVKFAYKEQALHASKQLNGKRTMEGCSRPLEVRFAESKAQRGEVTTGGAAVDANRMMRGNQFGNFIDPMAAGGYFPYGAMGAAMPSNNAPRVVGPWKEYFSNDGRPYYHNEMTNVTQWDRPVEFDQANRMRMTGGTGARGGSGGETTTGPPGANIFVFHIPAEWSDAHLYDFFSQHGAILSASIAKDKVTGRNRGYGFVSYASPASATAAVSNLNGHVLKESGKRLKVSFKLGEAEQAGTTGATSTGGGSTRGSIGGGGGGGVGVNGGTATGISSGCMQSAAMNNMMNQYNPMQGAPYGAYAGNRYAPY